jgi:hypothetical protein
MHVQKYAGTTRRSGRQAVWTGRVNFDDAALDAPLRWRKPLRIFVNSMSDLFQDPVPVSLIHRGWDVMEKANWLEVLIPILYLKGISTGDFEEALAALLGKDAGGLSASTIARRARFAAIRQSDRVYGRDR